MYRCSPAMSICGQARQSANGQHDAGTGLLHCDLCSVFCMSDCVIILSVLSGFCHRWLEKRSLLVRLQNSQRDAAGFSGNCQ